MKLITKNIIHQNFELYYRLEDYKLDYFTDLKKYSREELLTDIGRAKNYLLKERNFERGDKVLLATSAWPNFIVWFFAVLELGGSFVVSDSPTVFLEILQKRLSLYGKIDHLIWYDHDRTFDFMGAKFTNEGEYLLYDFCQDAYDLILAKETDIVMYSTSSGTTNIPKVCEHSHEFFYDLLHRNAKVFDLKENDRCLHTKNLHHGSVLGVYLLPTIKFCKNHFWQSLGNPDESWQSPLIDVFKKHRINRCLLYYSEFLDALCDHFAVEDFDYSINICLLSKFSKKSLDHLVGNCGHKFISIFGCTETSGPLFLLTADKENYQRLGDCTNFQKPLDNFYEINLNNGILEVGMPDENVISTGDEFDIVDGDYIFRGRKSGMRINGYPIYLGILSKFIEKFSNHAFKYGENFDLTMDTWHQKIYMRSDFNFDLDELNNFLTKQFDTDSYNISYVLISNRSKMVYGIKLDSEKLRYLCRQALDLPIE
jgi:hypothetical protein